MLPDARHLIEQANGGNPLRAAIYARYSNKRHQRESSIEDQIRTCEQVARREGLNVVSRFFDKGISGSSTEGREGLDQMLAAARRGEFQVFVTESIDRMSRDDINTKQIERKLRYCRIPILTVADGYLTPLSLALKSLMAEMFLGQLAINVRRSHKGLVANGRFPGSIAYGYQRVAGAPGEIEIDPVQAKIVRRIFQEYVEGRHPRAIIEALNNEGIPGPRGKRWQFKALAHGYHRVGKTTVARGLIAHTVYHGKLVWGATKREKHPERGIFIQRPAPESEWESKDVPHLRIVDEALWQAAQDMRLQRSRGDGKARRRKIHPRTESLLTGILKCGECGGPMRIGTKIKGAARVQCKAAHTAGECDHRKSYDLPKLESSLLDQFREKLTDKQRWSELVKLSAEKWQAKAKASRRTRDGDAKRLTQIEREIGNIGQAIAVSTRDLPSLVKRLSALEDERAACEERIKIIDTESNVIELHPGMPAALRKTIDDLYTALTDENVPAEKRQRARFAFRTLIESVVVHKTGWGAQYEFTPYARLGAMAVGVNLFPDRRSVKKVLQESGFENCDNGAVEFAKARLSQNAKIVPLGRWGGNLRKAA